MALEFKTYDKSLIISGKTFVIKDLIKTNGGKWDDQKKSWSVPIEKDSPDFRLLLLDELNAAIRKEKALKAAARSPEGIAAAKANERAIIKRLASQGSYWICCENCTVVDWMRKHTTCDKCAQDGNSFRVRGILYTGD
jgi:hypothetical protein